MCCCLHSSFRIQTLQLLEINPSCSFLDCSRCLPGLQARGTIASHRCSGVSNWGWTRFSVLPELAAVNIQGFFFNMHIQVCVYTVPPVTEAHVQTGVLPVHLTPDQIFPRSSACFGILLTPQPHGLTPEPGLHMQGTCLEILTSHWESHAFEI